MWFVIGVPKQSPVVTTVGLMFNALIASYVAMHSGCVVSVMNTSAVSAPTFWIAVCTSAAVPPGSTTCTPATSIPAFDSTGFSNVAKAPCAAGLLPYITATFLGFGLYSSATYWAMPVTTPTAPAVNEKPAAVVKSVIVNPLPISTGFLPLSAAYRPVAP